MNLSRLPPNLPPISPDMTALAILDAAAAAVEAALGDAEFACGAFDPGLYPRSLSHARPRALAILRHLSRLAVLVADYRDARFRDCSRARRYRPPRNTDPPDDDGGIIDLRSRRFLGVPFNPDDPRP